MASGSPFWPVATGGGGGRACWHPHLPLAARVHDNQLHTARVVNSKSSLFLAHALGPVLVPRSWFQIILLPAHEITVARQARVTWFVLVHREKERRERSASSSGRRRLRLLTLAAPRTYLRARERVSERRGYTFLAPPLFQCDAIQHSGLCVLSRHQVLKSTNTGASDTTK